MKYTTSDTIAFQQVYLEFCRFFFNMDDVNLNTKKHIFHSPYDLYHTIYF